MSDLSANTVKFVDYLDGFQYAGEVLQFFPHAEGYIKATPQSNTPNGEPTSYTYNYAFNYTDHLGNVRLSYSKDPATNKLQILEENHYYPFGLKHSAYDTGSKRDFMKGIDPGEPPVRIENVLETAYQYKFGAKEWQDELGLNIYDFEARNYMPDIVRTTTMDPLAETFHSQSSYSFFNNNPVRYADPTGMAGEDFIDVDKFSGKVTVAKATGDDKMRLIGEGGKVEKIETYGENGSFNRDSNITTNDIFASNGEYLRTEQIIESKNPDKLFNLFEFASNGNTVEYGFLRTQDNWKSGGYMFTAGLIDTLGQGFNNLIDNLMSSSISLNITEMWHNHPVDLNGGWMNSFRPSGFELDGRKSDYDFGDRAQLISKKSSYIGRFPESANILLSNTNLMIRYNENNFKIFYR